MADTIIDSRIRDTTSTTGTGAITVTGTAPTNYKTFSAAKKRSGSLIAVNDRVPITIVHRSAAEWEESYATYTAVNELTRTTVLKSSNSDSAVSFSAGTKDVYLHASPTHLFYIPMTSFTPTWTSLTGTPPAIGNGTLNGRACRNGDVIQFWIDLIAGSTTTNGTGTVWYFSLPAPFDSVPAVEAQGFAHLAYPGVNEYFGTSSQPTGTTTIYIKVGGTWGPTWPSTFASTDECHVSGSITV